MHSADQSPDTVFQENSELAVLEFAAGAELGPPVRRLFESDINASTTGAHDPCRLAGLEGPPRIVDARLDHIALALHHRLAERARWKKRQGARHSGSRECAR